MSTLFPTIPTTAPTQMTNRDGLSVFLTAPRNTITRLTREAYDQLTPAERDIHDDARRAFLSTGFTISTDAVEEAKMQLRNCIRANYYDPLANQALMLSGEAHVGKTTIARSLMKYTYTQLLARNPDLDLRRSAPVVYVEVPAGSTAKSFLRTFIHHFGLTATRTETTEELKQRVVQQLLRLGTVLVVVDEFHNLEAANRGNGETIDQLKLLQNAVPATFVYAGINLERARLLSGPGGQQLSARSTLIPLNRFNPGNPDEVRKWTYLVAAFEKQLPLLDHELGAITNISKDLMVACAGSIGTLRRMLTHAVIPLIGDDSAPEHLTPELILGQRRDMATEQHTNTNDLKQKAATR